jgi:hypothetical protein
VPPIEDVNMAVGGNVLPSLRFISTILLSEPLLQPRPDRQRIAVRKGGFSLLAFAGSTDIATHHHRLSRTTFTFCLEEGQ